MFSNKDKIVVDKYENKKKNLKNSKISKTTKKQKTYKSTSINIFQKINEKTNIKIDLNIHNKKQEIISKFKKHRKISHKTKTLAKK